MRVTLISTTSLKRVIILFIIIGIVLHYVKQTVQLMNLTTPKILNAVTDLDSPTEGKQNAQKQASAFRNSTVRGGQDDDDEGAIELTSISITSENNPNSGNDINKTGVNFPVCKKDVCCASWEVDLDPWWQQNPTWHVSDENATHFCFSKLPSNSRYDMKRIAFLEALHQLQWHGNCSNVHAMVQINSGLSASLNHLHNAFVTAWATNRPFQITVKKKTFAWAYATYKNGTGLCATRDVYCYFLPISNCQARITQNDGADDLHRHITKNLKGRWLREYFTRPRQWLRLALLKYRESPSIPKLKTPCATIHVRRTDVTLEGPWWKKRNYFPIADYVEHLQPGSNIFLMTDDQSAVDEALRFHPNYTWYFINRTRHYGASGGFNQHLPSKDPLLEMMIILSELRLASLCKTLVHTTSGFVDLIREAMESTQGTIDIIKMDVGKQLNRTTVESSNEFFRKLNMPNSSNIHPSSI
jgi:hypothetical protein